MMLVIRSSPYNWLKHGSNVVFPQVDWVRNIKIVVVSLSGVKMQPLNVIFFLFTLGNQILQC